MRDDLFFDPRQDVQETQRNLPHWKQKGRIYFITFRLADSLPKVKLDRLRNDRKQWAKNYAQKPFKELPTQVRLEFSRLFHKRVHFWLDAGAGSCILKQPSIGKIVADAMKFFDGKRYDLGAWVVAANHVHALVRPYTGENLSAILHSWKSFSAMQINKRLGRRGPLWIAESYDHLVRNPAKLAKFEAYILNHGTW